MATAAATGPDTGIRPTSFLKLHNTLIPTRWHSQTQHQKRPVVGQKMMLCAFSGFLDFQARCKENRRPWLFYFLQGLPRFAPFQFLIRALKRNAKISSAKVESSTLRSTAILQTTALTRRPYHYCLVWPNSLGDVKLQ